MKFSTAKEHRDFFQKHGWIEFEALVSEDQLTAANQVIDLALAERLIIPPERLRTLNSEKLFTSGRDLWRLNLSLQRFVSHSRLTEIVSELIETKPLRLGYDQLFPSRQQKPFPEEVSQVYSRFLNQIAPLQTVSCLQGIACGFIICLSGNREEQHSEENPIQDIDVFPGRPGNVIFFQPNAAINWNHLYSHLGQRFYLVVYALGYSHYKLEPQDPHTHALKRLGYVFNDKLNDRLNPIIYR